MFLNMVSSRKVKVTELADVKYLPYANQYLGMAHGNGYEHLKRWLKRRLIFTDTLFDYAPSYNNDVLTIRANTTQPMTITIETYTPVYQHLSWYNGQMDKLKIDGKTAVTFTGTAMAATDQEVLIYGGSNIKKITGISTMNPNSMLIGSATRLIELDIKGCPILTDINANKANLSAHTYLNKLDISDCPLLEGTLRINNSTLLRDVNIKGTGITDILFPKSLRNLETLRVAKGVSSLTLNNASSLTTLELEKGHNLQSISLSNCNNLTNTINFDLTKVPTVLLDNSYNAQELYMSATTNLTLKNMADLERVIYIPNNEYETFEITTLTNSPDYSVTTFNCPSLTTFMTTAPHRLSYNNNVVNYVDKEIITDEIDINNQTILAENYNANSQSFSYTVDTFDFNTQLIEAKLSLANCTGTNENIISFGEALNTFGSNTIHLYYTSSNNTFIINYQGNSYRRTYTPTNTNIIIKLNKKGLFIEDNIILNPTEIANILTLTSINIGSKEGGVRSKAVYEYIKYGSYATTTIQVKDYGDIKPNTTFTANSLDLSNTQFTDIKFLCTTDLYKLKLPSTLKNFYCDSAMDIDTDVIGEASYEVIHDELIEQYTTDYNSEVFRYETKNLTDGNFTKTTGKMIPASSGEPLLGTDEYGFWTTSSGWNGGQWISDFIQIGENTECSITKTGSYSADCAIAFCGEDKKIINYYRSGNSTSVITFTKTSPVGARYVVFGGSNSTLSYDISFDEAYTPNIIPSSSDGSLIFSMYAPSKTVEPAVNTWDLYGLELKDFYTYGMNNDVKPSEDSYVNIIDGDKLATCESNGIWWYTDWVNGKIGYGDGRRLTPIKLSDDRVNVTVSPNPEYTGKTAVHFRDYNGGINNNEKTGVVNINNITEIALSYYINSEFKYYDITFNNSIYRLYIEDITNICPTEDATEIINNYTCNLNDSIKYKKIYEVKSITMPKRYEPYSIQIKNANITPNNYPTMLYPLLVNTTLPITGKLDYTKYNGTSLAWAYAYTTNDVTRLPLDSRHTGQITNEYNKLYGTDFVDIVDVWAYKDNDFTNKTTNENITKAYIELTNSNYKTRIDEVLQWYPNCHDIYLFDDGSVTSLYFMNSSGGNNNAHGTRTQIQNVTFVEDYFNNLVNLEGTFIYCSNLVTVNNIPKTVIALNSCFESCSKLNCQFNFSEFNIAQDKLQSVFNGCRAITYPPILPSNYTGSMASCFTNCSSLVEAPVIPNGVTSMVNCFKGCTSLVSIGNIPSNCGNYMAMCEGCTSLTSVPTDGWQSNMSYCFFNCSSLNQQINISSTFNLLQTFMNCSSLSITPTLPSTANCIMQSCFQGCTSLVTPPVTPEGVTNMHSCYKWCGNLSSAPNIPESCNNIYLTFQDCSKFTSISIPLHITAYGEALSGCNSLTDITWTGLRTADFSLASLGTPSYAQADIKELVPEHLDDLYKDTIKLDCNNQKITINGNESIYVKSAKYVEYIQGDGSHYIDTGIYANPQWKYEIVFMDETKDNYENYFGSSVSNYNIGVNRRQNTDVLNINYAGVSGAVVCSITTTKSYKLCIDKNKVYLDDVLINSATESSDTTSFTQTILIFSQWVSSNVSSASNFKLYSFKMWDENGTLQFNGCPCLVNEKYPCLYDEVSKKFFFPK